MVHCAHGTKDIEQQCHVVSRLPFNDPHRRNLYDLSCRLMPKEIQTNGWEVEGDDAIKGGTFAFTPP